MSNPIWGTCRGWCLWILVRGRSNSCTPFDCLPTINESGGGIPNFGGTHKRAHVRAPWLVDQIFPPHYIANRNQGDILPEGLQNPQLCQLIRLCCCRVCNTQLWANWSPTYMPKAAMGCSTLECVCLIQMSMDCPCSHTNTEHIW